MAKEYKYNLASHATFNGMTQPLRLVDTGDGWEFLELLRHGWSGTGIYGDTPAKAIQSACEQWGKFALEPLSVTAGKLLSENRYAPEREQE